MYQLTDEGEFATDFGLCDQMRRADVSIVANIAEGLDCDSTIKFARFLGIVHRPAVEVQSLLYTALEVGCITAEQFKEHYEQAGKTKGLVSAFKSAIPKHC